jgi:predicted ATPase/DNA-binding SARP family transcriptional activator
MLFIHLFGELQLFDDDQPWKFSAPPKTLPLWAYLLLRRHNPLPRNRLASTLWPEAAEAEARANLRRHLNYLRRALPPAPAGRPWLLADGESVQWNPEAAAWLDVDEFERLSADPAGLDEAVALYTDDLLPGVRDEWLAAERERLRGRYFECLHRLVAQRQAQGDLAEAIAYAQKALQHGPLREALLRDLMTMQRQAGDRLGALQAYQQFAQRLRAELGAEPLPETRALYEALSSGSTAESLPTAPRPPAVEPGTPANDSGPPDNLPAQLTTFVGREAELAALCRLLAAGETNVRLVTVTGPGGVGKTRLALEAASRLLRDEPRRFADGVFFVGLSEIRNPEAVAAAIGKALELITRDDRPAAQVLQQFLTPRRTLLVLDNFEQVGDAAPLLTDLLAAAPGLQVMVTSRETLRLYGEHEFSLAPLALPDPARPPPLAELPGYPAVALFVERSRAVQPGFSLDEANARAVTEICVRLDGLPLAIELAASRSKLFAPPALLERLNSRLEFLTGQSRSQGLAERQQTLRNTIDWSYSLLEPTEQQLFACLGVFAGGFMLEAAEAVGQDEISSFIPPPSSFESVLASLVDKNMLRSEPEPGSEPSFRMLHTLREYALERLAEMQALDRLQQRHADYYLRLAEIAEPRLLGGERRAWIERLDLEHDNLGAAFEWCLAAGRNEMALRLVGALGWYWQFRAQTAEGRAWSEAALKAAGARPAEAGPEESAIWGKALLAAGSMAWGQSDYPAAWPRLTASADAGRAAGPAGQPGLAIALEMQGLVALYQGQLEQAAALYQESLALARQACGPWGLALILQEAGLTADLQGHPQRARALIEESLALYTQVNDGWGMALALLDLGLVAGRHGEFAEARVRLQQAQAHHRAERDLAVLSEGVHLQGQVALRQGDVERASPLLAEALTLARDLGDRPILASVLHDVGALALARGEPVSATRLFAGAAALSEAIGGGTPWTLLTPADRERDIAAARAAAPQEFQSAWDEGWAMPPSQIASHALQFLTPTDDPLAPPQ